MFIVFNLKNEKQKWGKLCLNKVNGLMFIVLSTTLGTEKKNKNRKERIEISCLQHLYMGVFG